MIGRCGAHGADFPFRPKPRNPAQAKAARQAKTGGSMLGGRKHAGLILVVIALVLMAIYVLPRFL